MTTLAQRIARKEQQLAKANDAYDELLDSKKQYTGDFGAGRVTVINRELKELEMTIKKLETEIDRLRDRLRYGGIVRVGLRRHG